MTQKPTIHKTCIYCTKDFLVRKQVDKRGQGKFCSLSCSTFYHSEQRGYALYTKVECAYCKAKFDKLTSNLSGSKSGLYFCNKDHKRLAQRVGGIKEIQPSHYGTGASEYRKIAFDNYPARCNRCPYDKYKEVLQVHHKDKNRKNNSISNLEVLCPTCHAEEHYILPLK